MLLLFSLIYITALQASPQEDKQEIEIMLQTANHLMLEQRYQEAADILEKILMIDSTPSGVIKTYQQALKAIEQQTENFGSQVQKTEGWGVHGKLSVSTGWGDNLNRAPTDKNIEITSGEGESALLELCEECQPHSGFGVEVNANILGVKKLNNTDNIKLSLQIQNRTTDKNNFTDYWRINPGISIQHQLKSGAELGVAFFSDVLQYDNKAMFYSLDLISRYAWKNNQTCRSQMGVDIQWNHQKNNQLFDSVYGGGAAATNCYWWGGVYRLGLSVGNEWALDDRRPGGGQQRVLVQLSHDRAANWLREQDRVNIYIHLEHRRDQRGYSTFLENGLKRKLNRLVMGGEYRFPVTYKQTPWWLIMEVEWQKQYSNIQLFEYVALEVWLGFEVLW